MKSKYTNLTTLLSVLFCFTVPFFFTACGDDDDGEPLSDAKEILSFAFNDLTPAVQGSISGSAITATVPFGTDVTGLVPTVTLSEEATVSPASGAAQDFSNPVTYTVTAEDGSEATYTVTVTVLPKFKITPAWEKTVRLGTGEIPGWFTANNDADIAFGNGSVYAMNNRDKIRILDPATGEEKVADQFLSHTVSVTGVYANIVGVKVDDGGNIIGSSGTTAGGNWHVYKWDDESATQEIILTWTGATTRIDNFAVVGDMDGNGYIYAASNGANEIYRWEVTNGSVTSETPTTTVVPGVANFGSFTAIFPMSADANSDLWINGNAIQPILVGADGSLKEELPGAITNSATGALTGFSSDLIYFELGTDKVLVTINTPNNDTQDLVFIDVTNGLSQVNEAGIQRVEFDNNSPASANANATGGLDFDASGSTVTVYGLITNNGIGAYTVELN